jgi:hypothetical protein
VERFSLGASWASPVQRVLLPDNRPRLPSLRQKSDQDLGAVTRTRRLSSALRIPLYATALTSFGLFRSQVTVAVVDLLQAIQVEQQNGKRSSRAPGSFDLCVEDAQEPAVIAQTQ